ncbi:MAG: UvrD-helicase domain-containing protein [Candidatus Gastranaerophilales bacterium]|nr:UvrD-helicase domain-containing protein [Candidatus Gastranaerophilales bacterium]
METKNKTQVSITDGLNEQQKQAVVNPINHCTKIVAGAGTGKTKIISKRFVKLVNDLIEDGVENPATRLLVITFTDKAANEMKGRIFQELKDNDVDCLGQDLWISTFHSFCSRILRKHSIEANLSPSLKMGEEKQLKDIFDNIIKRIKYGEANTIENLNETADLLGLNAELLNIDSVNKLNKINDLDVILDDIFPLIKKIKSLGIDAKEFLDKSTVAIKNYSKTIKTIPFGFSSKEEYLEEWEQHLKAYADDFCRYEDIIFKDDGKKEDKGAFQAIASEKLILDKNNARGKNACLQWSQATSFPENIDKIEEIELHLTKIVALIYAVYQKELEKLDTVDFDDLINKTIQILKQNEIIRLYYQKLFKHLIIDEFQDTNGSQLELIKLLLDNNNANITFVGDRKQSIYGFRFAQMENLEVLHNYIENKYSKKYEPITLEYNYRSTPHVLNAVNHVTKECLNLNEILNPNPNKTFDTENKHVKVTTLNGFSDSDNHKISEAKYIASEIIRLTKEENAKYKEFAVLVKSHSQAELIEKQLTEAGIPSIKKVNIGFFINPVIRNAVALLRLAKNIRDEIALARILKIKLSDQELYRLKIEADKEILKTKEFKELKKLTLSEKLTFIRENNLINNLDVPENVRDYTNRVFETIYSISQQKNTLSLLQIYYKLINEIKPYLELSGIEQYRVELDLRIFEKIIADFMQSENYVSISNFLDYIDRIKDNRSFELPTLAVKDIDAVQLLTVHASKGLEFPYTFIASISTSSKGGNSDGTNISFDLQYGDKPGFGIIVHKFEGKSTPKALLYKEIWKKPREKNEALRLFYVAVSRAEKYLNILNFEPYGNSRPAEYTRNFPMSVLSEAIDTSEITIEKQELRPFAIITDNQRTFNNRTSAPAAVQANFKMSFSQINTFNHCPNKYLFKYKYRYPELGNEKESSIVGSIVHNLIYSSYMNNKEFSEADIPMFLSGVQLESEDSTRINSLYSSFLTSDYSPQKLSGMAIYPERSFNFTHNIDGKNIEFTGDIDLLIKNADDTYSIIDFKTNKNIEKSLEDYYKQLYLYKMALSSERLNINELKILNLTDEAAKIFEPRYEELSQAENILNKEIISILSLANNTDCEPNANNQNCRDCGYLYICENSDGDQKL